MGGKEEEKQGGKKDVLNDRKASTPIYPYPLKDERGEWKRRGGGWEEGEDWKAGGKKKVRYFLNDRKSSYLFRS